MKNIDEGDSIFRSLSICLTDKCNMSCSYCLRECDVAKRKMLPLESIKKAIDFFVSMEPEKTKYIQLTGGEVFLYPDIYSLIEYILAKGCICRLQTNGLLLRHATLTRPDLIGHPSVVIKASLDGWNERINSKYRGVGTFRPIVIGIESTLTLNKKVAIKTVIHEGNFDGLNRMLDFCMRLGVAGWSYNTLMQKGRSNLATSVSQLDVVKKLIPLFNTSRYCRMLNGTDIQIMFWMFSNGISTRPKYFFINYDGGIYITDRTESSRHTGSIFNDDLKSQFVLKNIDLTVPWELLSFVGTHLNVEIEKKKVVAYEK